MVLVSTIILVVGMFQFMETMLTTMVSATNMLTVVFLTTVSMIMIAGGVIVNVVSAIMMLETMFLIMVCIGKVVVGLFLVTVSMRVITVGMLMATVVEVPCHGEHVHDHYSGDRARD